MIAPDECEKMLAVRLCGPRVISRLDDVGIERLSDLADWSPEELVVAVNLAAGRPIWNGPIARQAMANLIQAARRQTRRS
jgi:hypothetical protein